jgi:hypothetical protein
MGFVRKIGRKIDDAIIRPVLNTVESIVEDPKKLAMVALSVFAPGAGTALGSALGLTGTAATVVGQAAINTALNGGDVKAGIIAAAIPVVGREIAGTAAASFVESGMDKTLANSAGRVVANAGVAAIRGQDPVEALLSGGLSAGASAVTGNIPGFNDLPDSVKRSITAGVAAELSGGDGSQAMANSLVKSAVSYATNEVKLQKPLSKEDIAELTPRQKEIYDESGAKGLAEFRRDARLLGSLTRSGRTGDDMGGDYNPLQSETSDTAIFNEDRDDTVGSGMSSDIIRNLEDAGLSQASDAKILAEIVGGTDTLAGQPTGLQVASASTGTTSDAGGGVFRTDIGGSPIYAESSGAARVTPPFGYRLTSATETDTKPAGSYYDPTANAWFSPDKAVTNLTESDSITSDADLFNKTVGQLSDDTSTEDIGTSSDVIQNLEDAGLKETKDTTTGDVADNTVLITTKPEFEEAGFPDEPTYLAFGKSKTAYDRFGGNAASYNAAKTAAENAIKMAVRREGNPLDLRYDVNRDGKVTSADSLLLMKGEPIRTDIDASGASTEKTGIDTVNITGSADKDTGEGDDNLDFLTGDSGARKTGTGTNVTTDSTKTTDAGEVKITTPKCEAGFVYDEDLKMCVPIAGTDILTRGVGTTSSTGGAGADKVTNAGEIKITTPKCETGFVYDEDLKQCVPIAGTNIGETGTRSLTGGTDTTKTTDLGTVTITGKKDTCPTGTTLNPITGECDPNWDEGGGETCPAGQRLDTATGMCVPIVTTTTSTTCPTGQTYDAVQKKCVPVTTGGGGTGGGGGGGGTQISKTPSFTPSGVSLSPEILSPIYAGKMGDFNLFSTLEELLNDKSNEKDSTNSKDTTKMATGGHLDDLLAEQISVDDLLKLLR